MNIQAFNFVFIHMGFMYCTADCEIWTGVSKRIQLYVELETGGTSFRTFKCTQNSNMGLSGSRAANVYATTVRCLVIVVGLFDWSWLCTRWLSCRT